MNDVAVPLQQSDLTPAWLTAALRDGGVVQDAQVIAAGSEPIGAGFVGDVARVRLSYDRAEPGAPPTIIAKLPTLEPRRRLMSSGAHFFEREIKFYEDIAPGLDVRTPRRYYSATDPNEGRHVLLLEDLAPAHNGDQVAGCSPAEAELAVRSIARLHAAWWESAGLTELEWMPLLAGVHPSAEAWWDQMWGGCVARAGGRLPASVLRIGEHLGANAMYALRQLDAAPHTIVHGDFRLDNLFFGDGPEGVALAVVDWQLSTRGCGVYDVAYLLSGGLAPAVRKEHEARLVRAWHEELLARGVRGYSFDDAWYGYRLSVMVCLTFVTVMLNVVEPVDARALQLVDVVMERAAAAANELNVGELLPGQQRGDGARDPSF